MAEYIELTDLWSAPLDYIIDTCGSSVAQGFIDRVNEIKPANVRPVVHGRWIDYDDDYGALCCSVCDKDAPEDTRWPFCPNCGADMRGEG